MNCPKCRRKQYMVCSNLDCWCQKKVPENKLAQVWTEDGEGLSCPYCGFTADASYWESRNIEYVLKKNGVSSFGELLEKKEMKKDAKRLSA